VSKNTISTGIPNTEDGNLHSRCHNCRMGWIRTRDWDDTGESTYQVRGLMRTWCQLSTDPGSVFRTYRMKQSRGQPGRRVVRLPKVAAAEGTYHDARDNVVSAHLSVRELSVQHRKVIQLTGHQTVGIEPVQGVERAVRSQGSPSLAFEPGR
jgi:hypothetical protein